jgi:DNA-binding transcriptional MocR family regulator
MIIVTVRYSITGTGAESIAASVEEGISEGALAPGDALPSIREVAAQLGVNANTVAAAYRLLRDRGAIETAGRRGTRVRDRPATTPRSLLGLAVPEGARDLSSGNPDPAMLPIGTIQFALDNPSEPVLYGRSAMSAELIEHASADLSADGVPTDHLAVTSGALDGIERVLTAHLRPGDRVAVEDPGWANLLDLIAALGLSPEPVRVDDEGPLVLSMARALRRGVRAVVVTTRAQNPTGAALSKERAAALRSLLAGKTTDVLVIEDDHCAGISGAPLHALAGATRHGWCGRRSICQEPQRVARRFGQARRGRACAIRPQCLDPGARRDRGHHPTAQRGLGRGAGNSVPVGHTAGNADHHRRSDRRRD